LPGGFQATRRNCGASTPLLRRARPIARTTVSCRAEPSSAKMGSDSTSAQAASAAAESQTRVWHRCMASLSGGQQLAGELDFVGLDAALADFPADPGDEPNTILV